MQTLAPSRAHGYHRTGQSDFVTSGPVRVTYPDRRPDRVLPVYVRNGKEERCRRSCPGASGAGAATMASIQGGLLLTQVRRDPRQLRIALDAARANLGLAAA